MNLNSDEPRFSTDVQPRPAQPQERTWTTQSNRQDTSSEKVETKVFSFNVTKKKVIIFLFVFLTITISVLVSLFVTKPWEEKQEEKEEETDDNSSSSSSSSLVQSVVQSVMSFTPLGRQPSTCANGYINVNSRDLLSPSNTLVCVPGHIKVSVQGLSTDSNVDLCLIPNGNPQLPTYEGNTGRLEYSQSESRWKLTVGTLRYYLLNQVYSTRVPVGTKVWYSSDMSSRYIVIQVHNDPCSQLSTSSYNRDYADTQDIIPYYVNKNQSYADHNSEWRPWLQGNNALAYGPNISSLEKCVNKLRDSNFIKSEDEYRSRTINDRDSSHRYAPFDGNGNRRIVSSPLQKLINNFNHFVVEYRKPNNPRNNKNKKTWGNCVLKGVEESEIVQFSDIDSVHATSKFPKSVIT